MDYESYRKSNFADPRPIPRFEFTGIFGITLYFEEFERAVDYYSRVLGPPAYVEGEGTRGWAIGSGWLTLLRGGKGSPRNTEVTFVMQTPEQADRLQAAFVAAGGEGSEPTDTLMYEPVRYCPVQDPFGTDLLVISPMSAS